MSRGGDDWSDVRALETKLGILRDCRKKQVTELRGAQKLLTLYKSSMPEKVPVIDKEISDLEAVIISLDQQLRLTEGQLMETQAKTKATPLPGTSSASSARASNIMEQSGDGHTEEGASGAATTSVMSVEPIDSARTSTTTSGDGGSRRSAPVSSEGSFRRPRAQADADTASMTKEQRRERLSANVVAVRRKMGRESKQLAGLQRLMLAADSSQMDQLKQQFDAERQRLSTLGDTLGDIQASFIDEELQLRRDEYCQQLDIRVRVGTWNVNGAVPATADSNHLAEWLGMAGPSGERALTGDWPDLVVLGFQELEVTAETLVLHAKERAAAWREVLDAQLRPRGYRLVATRLLVGICVCFYARQDRGRLIKDVAVDDVGAGLWGKMGNKGGAAVRLRIGSHFTLVFVNVHLAAGQSTVARRNQDFHAVCQRLFGADKKDKTEHGKQTTGVDDHDVVVFFGDLNYRLDDVTRADVLNHVEHGDYLALLKHDQLIAQQRLANALVGFSEAPIDFAPTYKYDVGTQTYDTSDKQRVPAWCDRVLWKGDAVQCVGYGRVESLISDHRPVWAELLIQVEDEDRRRKDLVRSAIIQEALRHIDSLTNAGMPDCSLSQLSVTVGPRRATQLVHVSNVGQSPAQLSFIAKPDGSVCPPWLRVAPTSFQLERDTSCQLSFSLAPAYASSGPQSFSTPLDDVLVLHIDDGKDLFITVKFDPALSQEANQQPPLPSGDIAPIQMADLSLLSSSSVELVAQAVATMGLADRTVVAGLLETLRGHNTNTPHDNTDNSEDQFASARTDDDDDIVNSNLSSSDVVPLIDF